ncbi:hypothetical protein CLOP_g9157 [Closterium sp. NIES-67]|nr:hypothetical protein CLOP_g9157 [Closterium sp. NIES-67]
MWPHVPPGLLQLLELPTKPWTHVSMDFMTGLPAGASQNDAVLMVVDRLTKMAHFMPCRTTITASKLPSCSSQPSFACLESRRQS